MAWAPGDQASEDRNVAYRALQAWGRIAVAVFYRRTELTTFERLRVDRPAVVAANHGNGLGDIAVIAAKLPRFPHFLASASWWKSPPARLLFRLGGVLPIHRRRDGDTQQNAATFRVCHDALAAGAHLVIFPEGEMHIEPALQPLKTGAARIALGAAADREIPGVQLVPLGLVYAARGRFRSDLEVQVGEPIELDDWVERYHAEPDKAVRDLTDVLADRLADATVNHGSAHEAAVLDRAAAIALAGVPGARPPYGRRNAVRRALARAVDGLGGENGQAFRELEAAVDGHCVALHAAGLPDPRDAAGPDVAGLDDVPTAVRSGLARELAVLAVPAAVGVVAHAPVLAMASVAGRRAPDESWQATVKGVGATFLCPALWGAEYALIARRRGHLVAFAGVAAGIGGAVAALRWHDRRLRLEAMVQRERAAREHPDAFAAAVATSADVRARVEALTVGSPTT